MGTSRSAVASLLLPVKFREIQLGRPTDLLLDVDAWHVLGFVVLCGDGSQRFLPFGACQLTHDEIAVGSALMLLEDVDFYASRGASLRALLGGEVVGGGTLRDALVGLGGVVTELEVERGRSLARVPAAGAIVVPTRASAA
jgi:hypothetical protein